MRRERELMIAVVRMGRLFLTENAPHGASVSPKVKPARFIPVAATIGKRAHGLGTIRAALQMRPAHVLLPAGETLSGQTCRMAIAPERSQPRAGLMSNMVAVHIRQSTGQDGMLGGDRTSVVLGKSVSVSVDRGGRRNIKKKNK